MRKEQPVNKIGRSKQELLVMIQKEIRAATLFAQAVAKSSGMHPTDIRCLDFLNERGHATAGELSAIAGITTGAMTAVIDRMEQAGLVQRTTDAHDRRKVIIRFLHGHSNRIQATRGLLTKGIPRLLSEYNGDEIQTIIDWNMKITALLQEEARAIQDPKY
ncbi:MAG: MarR family transcriptional regulator [Candidatus Moranbacteria bacterium]|nr:MarR family transcriptional regulator [Candidatus Moranbacteria bacterium]